MNIKTTIATAVSDIAGNRWSGHWSPTNIIREGQDYTVYLEWKVDTENYSFFESMLQECQYDYDNGVPVNTDFDVIADHHNYIENENAEHYKDMINESDVKRYALMNLDAYAYDAGDTQLTKDIREVINNCTIKFVFMEWLWWTPGRVEAERREYYAYRDADKED